MSLYFAHNDTHGTIRLTKISGGYLSFGVGDRMIDSLCVVGMDPQANPPNRDYTTQLGMYHIRRYYFPNLMTAVATSKEALNSMFGMEDLTFTSVDGMSILEFTLDLKRQNKTFELFRESKNPPLNVVFAGGKSAEYAIHKFAQVLRSVDFMTQPNQLHLFFTKCLHQVNRKFEGVLIFCGAFMTGVVLTWIKMRKAVEKVSDQQDLKTQLL